MLDQRHKTSMETENLTQMKDAIQFHGHFYACPAPMHSSLVQSRIAQECTEEHRYKHYDKRSSKSESDHFNSNNEVLSKA